MKKTVLTTGLALALAGSLMAEADMSKANTGSRIPKDDKEKVSYTIGANIGSGVGADLKQSGIDVSNEFLIQGVSDALDGKIVMSEEERTKVMTGVMQKVQAQMQSKMEEEQRKMEAENAKNGPINKAASEKFLTENKAREGVKTTASGLQYKEGTTGKGPKPKATDVVKVNYKGTLINGTEFDSSAKHGGPATFPLNGVIKGWTEGLQLMPVGSKWTLYVPSELAYGDKAPPSIGPNQALIFEVELLEIQPPEQGN